jgi:hypothetical protein
LAFPAGICNLMMVLTFLGMSEWLLITKALD